MARSYNHIRSRYAKLISKIFEIVGRRTRYRLSFDQQSRHTMAMTLQYNKIPRKSFADVRHDLDETNTYLTLRQQGNQRGSKSFVIGQWFNILYIAL